MEGSGTDCIATRSPVSNDVGRKTVGSSDPLSTELSARNISTVSGSSEVLSPVCSILTRLVVGSATVGLPLQTNGVLGLQSSAMKVQDWIPGRTPKVKESVGSTIPVLEASNTSDNSRPSENRMSPMIFHAEPSPSTNVWVWVPSSRVMVQSKMLLSAMNPEAMSVSMVPVTLPAPTMKSMSKESA